MSRAAAVIGGLATLLLLPLFLVSLYNLVTAPRLERARTPARWPRVALLIPARNEEENFHRTLPAMLASDYPDLEIVVLDDASEDGTAALVERHARDSAGRLTLLKGSPLPAGWVGKTWACQQLAESTGAEILVFCDADVAPSPGAVRETVAWMLAEGADALTALPRQRLESWAEAALVPLLVQLPVLALLPLRAVVSRPEPAISMGNGQWLAMTRLTHERVGGHGSVRASVVEDVQLARRVKQAGLRMLATVGARSLEIRMYTDAASVRAGFRRTLFPLIGARSGALLAAVPLTLLIAVAPLALLLVEPLAGMLPAALLLGIRVCGARLFRHGWRSVALHPLGALAASALLADSYLAHRSGTASWKGRPLPATAR